MVLERYYPELVPPPPPPAPDPDEVETAQRSSPPAFDFRKEMGVTRRTADQLLADGKIYLPNQSGDVFVLRAGPKFELLATNSVGEPTNASLAVSDGELFLRTDKGLWCLANAK